MCEGVGEVVIHTSHSMSSGFLVKLLEMQSCRFGCRVECVQETFRRVGVTVEALLGVYNNLVQANVSHRCQQGYVSVTTLSCQLVLCVCVCMCG